MTAPIIPGVPTDGLKPTDLLWASLLDKPLLFPPSAHSHGSGDLPVNIAFKDQANTFTANQTVTGTITASGNITGPKIQSAYASTGRGFTAVPSSGWMVFGDTATLDFPSSAKIAMWADTLGLIQFSSDGYLGWSSLGGAANGSTDVIISRQSSGVLQIGNATRNASGSLSCAAITASGTITTGTTNLISLGGDVANGAWIQFGISGMTAGLALASTDNLFPMKNGVLSDNTLMIGRSDYRLKLINSAKYYLGSVDYFDSVSDGASRWSTPYAGRFIFTQGQNAQSMQLALQTAEGKFGSITHYDVNNAKGRLLEIGADPAVAIAIAPYNDELARFTSWSATRQIELKAPVTVTGNIQSSGTIESAIALGVTSPGLGALNWWRMRADNGTACILYSNNSGKGMSIENTAGIVTVESLVSLGTVNATGSRITGTSSWQNSGQPSSFDTTLTGTAFTSNYGNFSFINNWAQIFLRGNTGVNIEYGVLRFSGGSGASLVDTAGKLEVKNNGCISLADFGAANITVGAASNVKLWADGNGAVVSQTTGGAVALKVLNGWGVYFDNSLKVHLAGSIAGDGAVQITSTGNLTAKGNITVGSSTPGFSPISLSNSIAGIGNRIAVFESPTTGTYFYGTGLVISGSGYGLGFFGGTDAVVPTNTNYDMVINTSHNVIIGSTSDNGSRLQVAGGITCTGISTVGNITASGTISSPSGSNGTGERFGSGTVVGQYSVAIGNGAGNGNEAGVSIGYMAGMSYSCVGIGYYSNPGWRGVAIGAASSTTSIYGFGGVAIGYSATAVEHSVAIGPSANNSVVNTCLIGSNNVPLSLVIYDGDLSLGTGGSGNVTKYVKAAAPTSSGYGNHLVIQASSANTAGQGGSVYLVPGVGAGGPGAGTIYLGTASSWVGASVSGTLTVTNNGPNTGTALNIIAGGSTGLAIYWDNLTPYMQYSLAEGRQSRFVNSSSYTFDASVQAAANSTKGGLIATDGTTTLQMRVGWAGNYADTGQIWHNGVTRQIFSSDGVATVGNVMIVGDYQVRPIDHGNSYMRFTGTGRRITEIVGWDEIRLGINGAINNLDITAAGTSIAGNITATGHITSVIQSLSTDPTGSDLISGQTRTIKNTSTGTTKVWLNDGGAFKSLTFV